MSLEQHGDLLVIPITNGAFMENCYLAADATSRRGLLIDPGEEVDLILEQVRVHQVTVELIVCTHGHIDHVGAVAPLKQSLGAPFAIHALERPLLRIVPAQAALFGVPKPEVPEVDRELQGDEILSVGALTAKVLFTPGHSPGGCCIYFPQPGVLFAGDTLFAGSIGRTDLPGGSLSALLASIHEQLLTLDDKVVVYSGHGPATTIGAEREDNPFLV